MQDEPDAVDVGCDLLEYLQPLSANRRLENRKTGEVPARPRHSRYEATADWIADEHEYDRYGGCFLLQDRCHQIRTGYDHVRCHADQFFSESPRLVDVGASPADVDLDVAAFRPTQFLEAPLERRSASPPFNITFRVPHQQTDSPHPVRLLCPRRERPRGGRATEKCDELAPPHAGHRASSPVPE
jgi:hypothetical protein